ncbi:MAG: pentapeptide repeat-containing protein [Pyrinomonadaceae bacterium]
MISQQSKHDESLCHINEDIHTKDRYLNDSDDVRANVCIELPTIKHKDGKQYCILHLPAKDKDEVLFDSVLNERIKSVENEFINIENNLTKYQKPEAKSKLKYDFRYVWFPKEANLSKHIFVVSVDFSDAVFIEGAFFSNSLFSAQSRFVGTKFKSAIFNGVKFNSEANFLLASFEYSEFISTIFNSEKEASFQQAKFTGHSSFYYATFGNVDFSQAKFSKDVDFESTTFSGESKFNETTFSNTGKTSFYKAKFTKDTFFDNTKFNNDVSFNSAIFGSDSDIIFRDAQFEKYVSFRYSTSEGYLRFINLKQGNDCLFKFEEAAFEKANRISFYNLRLQPHWFVGVDSSKFVFTNCSWKQPDNSNVKTKSKLAKLSDTPKSNKLLTKTCWQLANNHDASNSFSKASIFRQMANESKRLEDSKGRKLWSLHWWYWLLPYYGESPLRAGLVLIGVLFLFAVAY